MRFSEALNRIVSYDDSRLFGNPFMLYSRLCDLCGESEADRKRALLFYKIDRELHVVSEIRSRGKKAYLKIIKSYSRVKYLIDYIIDEDGFIELIDEVTKIVNPAVIKESWVAKLSDKTKIVICATVSLLITIGVALTVGLLGGNPWTVRQHVIGAFGGISIVGLTALIMYLLDCEYELKAKHTAGVSVTGAVAVINAVLVFILKQNYNIIFYWLTAYTLAGGAFLIWYHDNEWRSEYDFAQIPSEALSVIALAAAIVHDCFGFKVPWAQMQHVIGSLVAVSVAGVTFGVIYFLRYKKEDTAGYIVGTSVSAALAVISSVLLYIFKHDFAVIFYWLTAFAIAGGGGMAALEIKKRSDNIAAVQVLLSVASAVALAAGIVHVHYAFDVPWIAWQYIIGVIGFLMLGVILLGIHLFLEKKKSHIPALICVAVSGALTVINAVLNLLLGADYFVIFVFLSAAAVGGGAFIAFADFKSDAPKSAVTQILVSSAALLLLVVGVLNKLGVIGQIWGAWQLTIVVFAMMLIYGLTAIIMWRLYDKSDRTPAHVLGVSVSCATVLLNAVLYVFLKQSYAMIFQGVSVFSILVGGFLIGFHFKENEKKFAAAQIFVAVANVASLVVGVLMAVQLLDYSWAAWQYFIAIFGGVILSGAATLAVYLVYDKVDESVGVGVGAIICGIIAVVNLALRFMYAESYFVIFCCFALLTAVGSGFLLYVNFAKDGGKYTAATVISAVITVLSAVAGMLTALGVVRVAPLIGLAGAGIVGAVALAGSIALVIKMLFDRSAFTALGIVSASLIGAIVLANMIMLFVFGHGYEIIYGGFIGALFVLGIVLLRVFHNLRYKIPYACRTAQKIVFVFTVFAVIVGVLYPIGLTWKGWQHIFGALGGAAIGVAAGFLIYALRDDDAAEIVSAAYTGVIMLVNSVLLFVFGPDYYITFFWLTAYAVAGGIVLLVAVGGLPQRCVFVTTVAMLVFGIVFSCNCEWTTWQFIIGAFGGAWLALIGGFIIGRVNEDYAIDDSLVPSIVAAAMCTAVAIINTTLVFVINPVYNIIFYWIAGIDIVMSFVMVFLSYKPYFKGAFIGLMALLVGSIVGASGASWYAWQHIIGAIGGAALLVIGILVCYSLHDNDEFTSCLTSAISSGATMLVNTALFFLLRESYQVIFYWLTAFVIASSIIAIVADNESFEEECRTAQAIILVATILLLVFAILVSTGAEWLVWQFIIGAIGGAGLMTVFIIVCANLYGGGEERRASVVGAISTGVTMLINTALFHIIRDYYAVIHYWIMGFLIISSIILLVSDGNNNEDECQRAQAFILMATIMLLAVNILIATAADWIAWQYVIGVLGGAALMVIGIMFGFKGLVGAIITGVMTAVNLALFFLLGEVYNIIYFWVNAYLIISSIILIVASADKPPLRFTQTLILIASVLLLLFGILIVSGASWFAWQFIIGIFGGGAMLATGIVLLYWLCDETYERAAGIIGACVTGVMLLLNFALLYMFGEYYRVIFFWLTAYLLGSSIALVAVDYENGEYGCNLAQTIILILTVMLLVFGIVLSAHASLFAWQFIIGIFGGIAGFLIIAFVLDHVDGEVSEIAAGIVGAAVCGTALIANLVLFIFAAEMYFITFFFIAGFSVIGNIVILAKQYSADVPALKVAQILILVGTAASIVLAILELNGVIGLTALFDELISGRGDISAA